VPEMNNNPLYDEGGVNPQDVPVPDVEPIEPPANPRVRRSEDNGYYREAQVVDEIYSQIRNSPSRSAARVAAVSELREAAQRFNISLRNARGIFKTAITLRREIKAALRNRGGN
jgi:hypothetical protein